MAIRISGDEHLWAGGVIPFGTSCLAVYIKG